MRFFGKRVAVTGAASGIGTAVAEGFAKEGASVAFLDLNEAMAAECAKRASDRFSAQNPDAKFISVKIDVADKKSVEEAFLAVESELCGLDIFVNCAGISIIVPMLDCTEEIWDKTLDVNLKGAFLSMQSAIRIMEKCGGGSIICMSSQSGKVGGGQYQAYCASKFGVIGLVQSAAVEFAKSGIRVNAVCPGVVLTPLWDKQMADYAKKRNIAPEEVMPYFASKIPMGRIGTLDDVVGTVFFLASDDSAYITGQSLNVSGGSVM